MRKGIALERDATADRVNAVFPAKGETWPIGYRDAHEAHWATCPNAATHREDSK